MAENVEMATTSFKKKCGGKLDAGTTGLPGLPVREGSNNAVNSAASRGSRQHSTSASWCGTPSTTKYTAPARAKAAATFVMALRAAMMEYIMPKRRDTNAVPMPVSAQPAQNAGFAAACSVHATKPVAKDATTAAPTTTRALATSFATCL